MIFHTQLLHGGLCKFAAQGIKQVFHHIVHLQHATWFLLAEPTVLISNFQNQSLIRVAPIN